MICLLYVCTLLFDLAGGFSVPNINSAMALPGPCGTMYLTTSTGYPYTYHNGVAYFHPPEVNTHASHWPVSPMSQGLLVKLMVVRFGLLTYV